MLYAGKTYRYAANKFILYKFYKREKLNIKPELELGKILYLKGLSAVNFLLRDFTQDNLSFVGDYNTSYNNNFNINSKDTCSNTNVISINTNSVLTTQSPKVKIGQNN